MPKTYVFTCPVQFQIQEQVTNEDDGTETTITEAEAKRIAVKYAKWVKLMVDVFDYPLEPGRYDDQILIRSSKMEGEVDA